MTVGEMPREEEGRVWEAPGPCTWVCTCTWRWHQLPHAWIFQLLAHCVARIRTLRIVPNTRPVHRCTPEPACLTLSLAITLASAFTSSTVSGASRMCFSA